VIQFSSSATPRALCNGYSSKVLGLCTAACVVSSFTIPYRPCRAAQVKVSELVEGLQLVHAGFFTEASFGQHLASLIFSIAL